MTELKTTSIKLTKEQMKFFDETKINKSAYVRDLIIKSKLYKDWEKDG